MDASLKELLEEIVAWCKADLQGFEEITPNEEMLRARVRVAQAALKKEKARS